MIDQSRLRIALEATSLLGPRTGVGVVTGALIERLATLDDLELTGLLISWRGRGQLAAHLPEGVDSAAVVFPARLAHRLWKRIDHPTVTGFDVVHGPNFVVPPSPGAAELVTVHDFGPWRDPALVTRHAAAYPTLVARAVGRGASVHVVSEFVADEAIEQLGIAPDRVAVVPNGFEPGEPGQAERGRSIVGGPYVLSLGTVEPRKDHPTLVAAMAGLWAEGYTHRLAIAGPDGWGTDALGEAIERAGAAERVVRLGYVSDDARSDLLAGAACLAFPSRYEGFGLPPLEAMAQDCPVVTTRAGALPEVCGDAARYVDVGDPDGLAGAIEVVLTDEAEAAALVAAGRDNLRRYSWSDAAAKMADLYRELAANDDRGGRR